MGIVETNVGEFIDKVYYDKVELDAEYDPNDTTVKVTSKKCRSWLVK